MTEHTASDQDLVQELASIKEASRRSEISALFEKRLTDSRDYRELSLLIQSESEYANGVALGILASHARKLTIDHEAICQFSESKNDSLRRLYVEVCAEQDVIGEGQGECASRLQSDKMAAVRANVFLWLLRMPSDEFNQVDLIERATLARVARSARLDGKATNLKAMLDGVDSEVCKILFM